jgi:hypothetical protein
MHRVLKKEGTVVMIWNLEDRRASWVARLREAYEKHEAGSPQYRLGLWRRPFEEPEMVKEVSKMFQLPIQERHISHSVPNTESGVWQRVLSKSYFAVLGAEEKEELKKEVDQIFTGTFKAMRKCCNILTQPILRGSRSSSKIFGRTKSMKKIGMNRTKICLRV